MLNRVKCLAQASGGLVELILCHCLDVTDSQSQLLKHRLQDYDRHEFIRIFGFNLNLNTSRMLRGQDGVDAILTALYGQFQALWAFHIGLA